MEDIRAWLFTMLAWNVHGGVAEKLSDPSITSMLYGADIVVLSETWLDEHAAKGTSLPGYVAHHCFGVRRKTRGRTPGGVSVFVRSDLNSKVTLEHMTTTPCCTLWLNVDKTLIVDAQQDVLLVASYLPPVGSPAYGGAPAAPFRILSDELEVRARGRQVVLLGDLNARVGTLKDVAPDDLYRGLEHLVAHTVPNHDVVELSARNNTDKVVNPFGRDLLSMCVTRDMVIANGRTLGDALGCCTFFADNGEGCSNVDLAVVSSSIHPSLGLLEVLPKWECSDHLPIILGWLTNNGSRTTTIFHNNKNYSDRNKTGLRYLEDKNDIYHAVIGSDRVTRDLTACFSSLSEGQCGVDEALHCFGGIIKKCMKKAFGVTNNKVCPTGASWWNADCENAKRRFRDAHRKDTEGMQAIGALRLSAETVALRRNYRNIKKKAKGISDMKNAEAVASNFFLDPRRFWKEFKDAPEKCPISDVTKWTHYFKGLVGTPGSDPDALSDDARVERFDQLFDFIHGGVSDQDRRRPESVVGITWRSSSTVMERKKAALALNTPFTVDEIIAAIKNINRRASPGVDGIPTQCIKEAWVFDDKGKPTVHILAPHLTKLFNIIYDSGVYPDSWTVTTITAIFKGKGSKSIESNYRGISVSCILAKLYGSVIEARLSRYLEGKQLRAWSQAGGRPKMGVLQHQFALQHFKDLYRAPISKGGKGAPLFVCLIDFEKAFDKVDRKLIWLRLEERGINGKCLEAIKAMYNKVTQKVKINGKLGEGFDTFYGVKQGDPLSTDLFGIMIEILDEYLNLVYPDMGVKIGSKYISGKYYIDDLSLMTGKIEDLQKALDIIEQFCFSFGFKVNIKKTEICVFGTRRASAPDVQVYYRGQLIKVVDSIKYLGLNFTGNRNCSPSVEHLIVAAERTRFAVQNRLRNISCLSPELKIRLGNLLIRPVASFGCQIWGVNFLELGKGVDGNELERTHLNYLRHILGVGKNIAGDILRYEAACPPYHAHWIILIFRLWNSHQANHSIMAHSIWKENITLFLKGCRNCWSYKVLKFAFEANITKFNPDNAYFSKQMLDAICTFTFDEGSVKKGIDTLYLNRFSNFVGICPKTAPSNGYAICKYINWTGIPGSVCDKNKYHQHLHVFMNRAHFYNLTRFRTGAWKIKVNSIHLHHINRNQRYCSFCTQNHNTNTVEDEEHVLFHCPEYDTCRQEYPDLLLGNMSIKNISDFDNQETIAKLLWKIRMIRIKLGVEC